MVVGLFFFIVVGTILVAAVLALGLVGIESLALALGVKGLSTTLIDNILHERIVAEVVVCRQRD